MPDFISVKSIVDSQLCTQCGTCVVVCPTGALKMQETSAGFLHPFITEYKCVACGKCRRVCPGAIVDLKLHSDVDPFKGNICEAYVGHACDESIRVRGQSGGVVSALLLYLLETGQANAALVTSMPSDGSLRPKSMLARTKSEILEARGSKYCPVAANKTLKHVLPGDNVAIVGPACHMHGIQLLARNQKKFVQNISCKIGLFCDRTLLYTCIDQMAKDAKCDMSSINSVEYRSKARNGWPGEVCFHLNSGKKRYFPKSLRMNLKDYFTPPRCRLCFDKMNILSDISIGDSYEVSSSRKGYSVFIARNKNAVELINDSCRKGYLQCKKIDAELIFNGQRVEERRNNFVIFSREWVGMGRNLPEYKGLNSKFLPPVSSAISSVYKENLMFNCRIAECDTKQECLKIVSRNKVLKRVRRLLTTNPLVTIKRIIERINILIVL
ncbi:MAG: Coenzyme F420 hydrogenase/dehydrogenase, beta subunit C-terminal domain [Desulfobulbaceae bacterium]|nr:Coenzyme F420 hydrogenase/dehydrogenase, beta subunit C-terminal domain [Desulfobulbaceae bacterium]